MENNISHGATTGSGGVIGTVADLVGIKGNERTTSTGSDSYNREEINNLKKFIEERDRQRDRETQQEKERQRDRDARQDKLLAEIKQYITQQEQRQIQQERNKQEQTISELKNHLDRQTEKNRDLQEQKQNERITALEIICNKHEKEYDQLQKERLERQFEEHSNKKNQEERLKALESSQKNIAPLGCQPHSSCQPNSSCHPQSCMQGVLLIKKPHSCSESESCHPCD